MQQTTKDNTVIEKIDFGPHEQEVKKIWNTSGITKSKFGRINKLLGYGNNKVGHCCICYNLNSHLLKRQINGATIVTRYCDDHLPMIE